MIVFPSNKLICFAIPKTGSTAFEQSFGTAAPDVTIAPDDEKHTNVRQFELNLRENPSAWLAAPFERMAILRDPLDRLRSWFRYRRRLPKTHPNSTQSLGFEDFIQLTMLSDPPPNAMHVGNQWEFCIRKNGGLGIHHIFDIGNRAPLDDFLQKRFGRGFPLQRVNVSQDEELSLSSEIEAKLRLHRTQEFAFYESVAGSGGYLQSDINS